MIHIGLYRESTINRWFKVSVEIVEFSIWQTPVWVGCEQLYKISIVIYEKKQQQQQTNKGFLMFCKLSSVMSFKGALDKYNIIPQLFPKKNGIFIPLEVMAWVMTTCWVLLSRLIYFWRNMNISSIFYFSKSTSKNTQYSSLWDTLRMMLFTKYLIKWKCIGRISWKFGVV